MGLRTMNKTAIDILADLTTRERVSLGSVQLILLECLISMAKSRESASHRYIRSGLVFCVALNSKCSMIPTSVSTITRYGQGEMRALLSKDRREVSYRLEEPQINK